MTGPTDTNRRVTVLLPAIKYNQPLSGCRNLILYVRARKTIFSAVSQVARDSVTVITGSQYSTATPKKVRNFDAFVSPWKFFHPHLNAVHLFIYFYVNPFVLNLEFTHKDTQTRISSVLYYL